ncbi:MAG: cupredoxin domain-containing protein [Thaumarchaeota archaeon]|nr:cupredoxin domain-containing protein [Nitrososphaerota archaeon]
MKSKYVYGIIATLMIAAVTYPVVYTMLNKSQGSNNPFFCAPLVPCQKQPPGSLNCSNFCIVNMKDSSFSPGTINATRGATIEWINLDGSSHTVSAFNSTAWNSPLIPPGHSFNLTVTSSLAAGSYYYFCNVHPFMIGLVNILPSNS